VSPINSCKIPVVIGLAGMAAFTIVTALTPSTLVAVIAMSTALAFNGMAGAMCWPWPASPRRGIARVAGVDPELRRLYRRRAGSDDHRVHRAGHREFRSGAAVQRGVGLTCALVYVFMVPGQPIDVAKFGGEAHAAAE